MILHIIEKGHTMVQQSPDQPPKPKSKILSIVIGVIAGILLFAIILMVGFIILSSLLAPKPEEPSPIIIVKPEAGEVLDTNNPILAGGIGAGLPEDIVIVQALDIIGNVLAEQDVDLEGEDVENNVNGHWIVQISVKVPRDTQGVIRAYSPSADNETVFAEDTVTVTFKKTIATPVVEPSIKITVPIIQAVLDATQPINVMGKGTRLPEGHINVQALDADGSVLAQESTTIQSPDAGTGGEGPWEVQLTFAAEPGTQGKIRAYSTSPKDGSVIAEDTIEVTYLKKPTIQPYITITEPLSGSVVEIANPLTIKGMGRNLPEGNLVLQALDSGGEVLSQQSTTIQVSDAGTGGEGSWEVQLQVAAEKGSSGQIRAFSTSPEDGSIIAEARIQVTYGTPPEIQPYITFIEPINGAVLDITKPVTVKGMGRGLPEGNVFITALDTLGNVLSQQTTTVQAPDDAIGGVGPWSAQLSISVEHGTPGIIRAYSSSPEDGSTIAEASIEVTYGSTPAVEPFITIIQPVSSAVLDFTQSFSASGMGGGLFEGNVVVQALDPNGNVLDQQAAIIQSPDAGTGGQGPWDTQLTVNVEPGTKGRIYAFSTSPRDGRTVASASVDVTYGEAQPPEEDTLLEEHLWLLNNYGTNAVLAGTQITAEFNNGQMGGSAGCNTYSGSYERTNSELTIGPLISTQMFCATPEGTMEQETQYLALLEASAFFSTQNGDLSIMNQANEKILLYDAAVIGTIAAQGEATLPENVLVRVTLSDVSVADAEAVVIGEQTITNPAGFPIPFAISYTAEVIEPNRTYAVGVRITDETDTLIYINTTVYLVITQGNPSTVDVTVESVD